MTYSEYLKWQEYYGLEPFGEERQELRNGLLCSVVANSMGGNKTNPIDFVLFSEKKEEKIDDWAVNLLNAMMIGV